MRFGIPKLDELIGDIKPGSTVLISTIGDLGIEILVAIIRKNREKSVVFVTSRLKKWLERIAGLDSVAYLTLGEDFAPQELFAITHAMRRVPENYLVGVFFLQSLLISIPQGGSTGSFPNSQI